MSTLCGIPGLKRRKGADLDDGSDVKGANTWKAIDTPRFNNVIKAGTQAATSDSIESLASMPHIYLVLWDTTVRDTARCRIWVVRPQFDEKFQAMCALWYKKRASWKIGSTNFQTPSATRERLRCYSEHLRDSQISSVFPGRATAGTEV